MSKFYQRYIPPEKSIHDSVNGTEKRKRDSDATVVSGQSQKQKKKRKTADLEKTREQDIKEPQPSVVQKIDQPSTGNDVLDKYRISKFAKQQDSDVDLKIRRPQPEKQSNRETRVQERVKKSNVENGSHTDENLQGQAQSDNTRHTKLLTKFDRSKKWSDRHGGSPTDAQSTSNIQEHETHNLVPIPQPEQVEDSQTLPVYSTLPAWQANATNVVALSDVRLETLGLSRDTLNNLESHGFKKAFPIQATVIPLLLTRRGSVAGDLCVSAATGSGKTLAYVAPIVEDLRAGRKDVLRAVIVVPTRELVKQVRETCEMCTSGSKLRIATTLGSTSLQAERENLVEEEDVYDPAMYETELNMPMDWTEFSMEKALRRAREKDLISLTNYTTRTRLKANILITTPGRLVDHLRTTDGFHLDDVDWFVVDEADRLLNESYQEWIDTVVPALESRAATKERDAILSHMRIEPPARTVTKILLSATMTQDISKLNSLGLVDPQLVLMKSTYSSYNQPEGEDAEPTARNNSNKYELPPTLQEAAISLKEGAEKPLMLLELLRQIIKVSGLSENDVKMVDLSDDTSSDGSSDMTSSSGSDSDSDTDSDSDPDARSSVDTASSTSDKEGISGSFDSSDVARRHHSNSLSEKSRLNTRALVFTRSTASASRLSRLLSILTPSLAPRIATLTRSTASSATSRKALTLFKSGKATILISTDRASRGIDVPGLEHVVNYDIPGSALTYVHRAGRTARAGNVGYAWTLVEHREGRWFWNEIGSKKADAVIARGGKIRKIELEAPDEQAEARYETALRTLGAEVRGE